MKKKIALAVTGASGSVYAKLLMREMEKHKDQIEKPACLFSKNSLSIWYEELIEHPEPSSFFTAYLSNDFSSPLASGSNTFDSMVICPASMGTIGRLAAGTSDDLILRAADVMLKEKRQLILVPRETPLNLIHLKNLTLLAEAGATIIPASPSFYSRPETVEEVAMTVVERILAHLGIHTKDGFRWGE